MHQQRDLGAVVDEPLALLYERRDALARRGDLDRDVGRLAEDVSHFAVRIGRHAVPAVDGEVGDRRAPTKGRPQLGNGARELQRHRIPVDERREPELEHAMLPLR